MIIDKAKLKGLAEAATPGEWVTDGEYVNEHGNVLYAYVAHEKGGRIAEAFANCLVKTDEECRANAAYIAAANPVVVLALLAEIERLSAQVRLAGVSAEMAVHQEVGRAATETMSIADERDQLKAEMGLAEEARDLYAADKKSLAFALNDARAEAEALRQIMRTAAGKLRSYSIAQPDRAWEKVNDALGLLDYGCRQAGTAANGMDKEASHG